MAFPIKQTIQVSVRGEPTYNRFGDLVPGKITWVDTKVFGWSIERTEEKVGDSLMRLIDELQLIAPMETPIGAAEQVKLPDGSVWTVEGNPMDYNNNPWFSPGLITFNCRKVTG